MTPGQAAKRINITIIYHYKMQTATSDAVQRATSFTYCTHQLAT